VRFLADPTLEPGRVVVKHGGNVIAMAGTPEMLPLIDGALLDGDETVTHPGTMWCVHRWIATRDHKRKVDELQRKAAEADRRRQRDRERRRRARA
jgi:hypothetical protein